jgi:sugar (pentulose or hexulose) kinase
MLSVLDKQDGTLGNPLVWLDNRAKAEAEIIKNEFGHDPI